MAAAGASPPDGAGTRTEAPSRREQILTEAARLFARHGFHGVSIADLGAAVGVSGPALYRHFPGKEALLAELLIDISERLLDGGRARVHHDDPRAALADLVDFHVAFATREPELIVVQDRDLANLPEEPRRTVRRLQRTYVELWVDTLRRVHPDVAPAEARTVAHGVFGLLNSTPYAPRAEQPSARGADARAAVLRRMALAALDAAPA
ncbi:Transcriptional regulator, TetR family [Pseudonocardia sp. Ae406_Ps2]|uniref:SACE_7040 family transcriptional regulator n=1 Tax=unclassified Pseudonocardia TaxID=2619320 RepID=UPI00094B1396|nr:MULTISPECIES: TetR/AcrR family transcriptional regulator [unclassified Pseudonocardia]OLL98132.1 Transcriptional regulator, TetR family [Pseudonocardia sp. Ae331_Ps2]OLM04160.1 Transcriptional regulator, TetR family [Pseudonocardia sp. Ae406_Ps2]OLM11012.1 Transcriptional regulator, TetR family [Pseudonocardia sp. Ae505_Ps2]OLM25711.1 Transcriptional regulator, TetR family [Pseudonocardia sp. Ae706_Ps2]OLM34139.1 Transcriptional regulator, TetR family [Pseudonocardia sp. Ae717_Ps2]